MADQIDARVKQKTGVEADFAGFVLLEGEMAMVRTSASGPVWNFKVGPGNFDSLDWSLQNPGAAQKADTSTVFPAGVPGLYIPTESGTYDGVSVDLSSGYTQLIWDGSALVKAEFPIDLTGYATKDYIPSVFNETLTEDTNLFDKDRDLRVGVYIDSSTGEDVINPITSRTGLIFIGENTRVFVRKTWDGAPTAYAWYDENQNFISYHSSVTSDGLPDAPGGEIVTRPENARYFSMNVTNNNSTQLPAYSDGLMVFVGQSMLDYSAYKIMPSISNQMTFVSRDESYGKVVSAMPIDSSMNRYTVVSGGKVGRWTVREDIGASASKTGNYITLAIDGSAPAPTANSGLLMPGFFRSQDVAVKVYYRFEARLVSGTGLYAIYSNNGASRVDVNIDSTDFKVYEVESVVGANQFGDNRLLFGVPIAETPSTIDIRHFQVYFVKPFGWSADTATSTANQPVNLSSMANFHYKKAILNSGGSASLVLGLFGDSWTDHVPGAIFYARDIARALRSELGNGGGGWYDFANSNSGGQKMASIDPLDADDTRSGTITYKDQTADAKGITVAHAEFGNGSSITLNVLTAHERFIIHYYGGASYGTFRYRIDGGSWETVDTSADDGHTTIAEDVSDATHVIDFEVTSGTCIIFGVDMQRLNGVRIHKFGNRGLFAYNMTAINPDDWQAAVASYNLDSMTVLVGTNDRTDNRMPLLFRSDIATIVAMYKAANQFGDLALISPSNNRNSATYPMIDYAAQIKHVANENGLPYLSTIPLFGSREQIIAKGTFADAVHPTEDGGKMIADYLVKVLL